MSFLRQLMETDSLPHPPTTLHSTLIVNGLQSAQGKPTNMPIELIKAVREIGQSLVGDQGAVRSVISATEADKITRAALGHLAKIGKIDKHYVRSSRGLTIDSITSDRLARERLIFRMLYNMVVKLGIKYL